MAVSRELAEVQRLVAAEAAGDKNAHGELLRAIRQLQLAVETPVETTSRFNFQVCAAQAKLPHFR